MKNLGKQGNINSIVSCALEREVDDNIHNDKTKHIKILLPLKEKAFTLR